METVASTFVIVLTIILMIVGLAGCLLPVIPGNILMGLTILGFAWHNQFERIGVSATILLLVISLLGGTSEIWLPLLGAKSGGASGRSILFGVIGATLGFIAGATFLGIGSLFGGLIGYFVGILISEYMRLGEWGPAFKAGLTGIFSWGVTQILQFVIGLIVFIIFFVLIA